MSTLVEGRTLRSVIETESPLDAARIARIVSQIARSLAEAHGHGSVHGDLKSQNITLVDGPDGEEVKINFGARDAGPAADLRALGAVLFEMISGAPCASLEQIAKELLEDDPIERIQTAEGVLEALSECGFGPPRPPSRRHKWMMIVGLSALTLLVAAMVAVILVPKGPRRRPRPSAPIESAATSSSALQRDAAGLRR